MQEAIEARLAAAGFTHYETSAFAQPGRQCRHNLNYWTFGDYLGIGAGAHGKLTLHDGQRGKYAARCAGSSRSSIWRRSPKAHRSRTSSRSRPPTCRSNS
jgi:coproporphyrinogen III oxidase-like Fe-S oxidoreductase